MNLIRIYILMSIVCLSLTCGNTYAAEHQVYKLQSDSSSCSAFVVSNNMAITAEHCVRGGSQFKLLLGKGTFYVDVEPVRTFTVGDLALLVGGFEEFNKVSIHPKIEQVLSKNDEVEGRACGFPWGSVKPVCISFEGISMWNLFFSSESFLFPGMSGGPVFVGSEVIGVNVALIGHLSLYSLLIGIDATLRINLDDLED